MPIFPLICGTTRLSGASHSINPDTQTKTHPTL